ncbi:hypothetical protein GCM10023310_70210 [Paenibacillus vulneris]|uniref:Uncharacterized protein n=1 Tax=Paenibacillus vulneris TaxID=1133364 RepID=A0ABW3UF29_9BACL
MIFLTTGEKDNLSRFMSKLFDINICYRAYLVDKGYKFENVTGDFEKVREVAVKSGVKIQIL